jgi:rhodanese-related sulfurtransferase
MTPTAVQFSAAMFFQARLQFQTDVSDVHAAMSQPSPGFVLVDSRGDAAWRQGHLPGALHLPTAQIAAQAATRVPQGMPVVTYCWGPGCNGATRAALAFAALGYDVREMLGGYEYWVREGLPVQTLGGLVTQTPDPLTEALASPVCDC